MADDDFDIYGDDEAYESVREVSSTASFDFDFECQLIPLAASLTCFLYLPNKTRNLLEFSPLMRSQRSLCWVTSARVKMMTTAALLLYHLIYGTNHRPRMARLLRSLSHHKGRKTSLFKVHSRI